MGLASLAFALAITAQAPRAQQDGAAGQSSPSPQSQRPSSPSPSTPSAPSPSSPSLGSAQATSTITGELKDVDTKTKTITVKTTVGPDMKFKYDDSTKIGGSTKGAAGLATMTGQQVTISYKKDGQSNMASNIELQNSSTPSPSTPRTGDRPGSPDSPRTPGADPTSPTSPRTPGTDPTSPRTPGSPDSPTSPESPRP